MAKGKAYKLDKLKRKIVKLVDKDDDGLTQYEDGEVIKKELDLCESFPEIIFVLKKFIFKVNEEELPREKGLRK